MDYLEENTRLKAALERIKNLRAAMGEAGCTCGGLIDEHRPTCDLVIMANALAADRKAAESTLKDIDHQKERRDMTLTAYYNDNQGWCLKSATGDVLATRMRQYDAQYLDRWSREGAVPCLERCNTCGDKRVVGSRESAPQSISTGLIDIEECLQEAKDGALDES